jgi:radical SAM protein with 4Fe4S-binding SPASM domain
MSIVVWLSSGVKGKMLLSAADAWIQKIPGVGGYYRYHYCTIRRRFFEMNRKLRLVKTPLYVHWLATYACNFHCKHCEAQPGERPVQELTTEEIVRAVCDMGDMGVKTFVVTGGEPLLRDDIFEVISSAHHRGIRNINMATNGFLVHTFERQLAKAHLTRVYISIDGTEPSNDRFRGVQGAFQKALEALDIFEQLGVTERIANTLVYQENIGELEALRDVIVRSSATLWNIQTALPVGRAREAVNMRLAPEQIRYVFNFIEKSKGMLATQLAVVSGHVGTWNSKLRSRPFFCGAGIETCSVMPDGEVLGCHVVYDNDYSEGNIKEKSFQSIWKQKNGRFRQPALNRTCRACEAYHACRGGCWAARLGNRPCIIEMCKDGMETP